MPEPFSAVLSNGARVLVEPVDHVRSAAVGLWCKTGSQNETDGELGSSHLFEHMAFKGTPTRTARDIVEAVEGRGGSINAFTDKETTCFFARVLADDVPNAIELLSDMAIRSVCADPDLALEKGVIVEEIRQSRDEPSERVHELHFAEVWPDHPLGRPISGTEESVSGTTREDLLSFVRRRYLGPNIVLVVTGYCSADAISDLAQKHLGDIPSGAIDPLLAKPQFVPAVRIHHDDCEQVHFCIGGQGISVSDERIHALAVLDAALGAGMSSRLFQEVREKRGLAYTIGSYSATFGAGGLTVVYGDTSPAKWVEVQDVVRSELGKLCNDGLTEQELEHTKRQICGHLVIGLEGMNSRMVRIARNNLYFNRTIPIDETVAKIQAVSLSDVLEVARFAYSPDNLSTTVVGPVPS